MKRAGRVLVLALPAWLPLSRPLRYEAQHRALSHHEQMSDPSRARNVTELLLSWGEGDTSALDRLIPLLYDDLRRVARGHLRRERPAAISGGNVPDTVSRRRRSCTRSSCVSSMWIG
jgi:hypothetical protein